jgi:hypothetical protein
MRIGTHGTHLGASAHQYVLALGFTEHILLDKHRQRPSWACRARRADKEKGTGGGGFHMPHGAKHAPTHTHPRTRCRDGKTHATDGERRRRLNRAALAAVGW